MCTVNGRLPSFYTPLNDHWPLPIVLSGVQLRGTRFDPALLQPGDFALADIRPPANILHAMAKRQTEFLAGRLYAHAALFTLDGHAQTPAISKDRTPVWPAVINDSITHGDRWVTALMVMHGDWRGLGLDVETLLETERACYLHGEILTKDERLRFANDLERCTGLLVTLALSLRENLSKAPYPLVDSHFYFGHAELLERRTDNQARLRLLTGLPPEWRHGSKLDAQFAVFGEHLLSLMMVGTQSGIPRRAP